MLIERIGATAVDIIQRTTYNIGGQMVGVRVVKLDANDNELPNEPGVGLFYTYSDHLGNVSALSDINGAYVTGSLGLHRPFGSYRVEPTTNPAITDHGFTGHKENLDLGLTYMNARYYVSELGRFASADTIVPDPMNPQQFNRYTYSLNSPINFIDPSGHCSGSADGVGNSHEQNMCWTKVNTIANSWNNTDYWNNRWGGLDSFLTHVASNQHLGESFFTQELQMYAESQEYQDWQAQRPEHIPPDFSGMGDYWAVTWTFLPSPVGFIGGKLILDDFGNYYFYLHTGNMPGASITRGDLYIEKYTQPFNEMIPIEAFPKGQQEMIMQNALQGVSGSFGGGAYALSGNVSIAAGQQAHTTQEGGLSFPGFSLTADVGKTWLIFDHGSDNPWFWQR